MLLSPKEHTEFAIVREEVRRALATVAAGGPNGVKAELEKGVLRHFSVQHLYARLGATLALGKSEADVLHALHPTPAVCGHPRSAALDAIRRAEPFDRGMYAGPIGFVGVDSAEFAVAIRSALVSPEGTELSLYAGVGVVAAAGSAAATTPTPAYSDSSVPSGDTSALRMATANSAESTPTKPMGPAYMPRSNGSARRIASSAADRG